MAKLEGEIYGELVIGKPGKSAYQYAVEGGYPGTEEQFYQDLASGIIGPQGPPGERGPVGPAGPAGERGPMGEPGRTPVNGEDYLTNQECLAALVETDMLPAVHDPDGKILTDANGNVIMRY